jgi:hypothetical protein
LVFASIGTWAVKLKVWIGVMMITKFKLPAQKTELRLISLGFSFKMRGERRSIISPYHCSIASLEEGWYAYSRGNNYMQRGRATNSLTWTSVGRCPHVVEARATPLSGMLKCAQFCHASRSHSMYNN